MFDDHAALVGSGILPTIFGFPTYTLFLVVGISAGVLYIVEAGRRSGSSPHGALEIVCSALIVGMIGSKVALLFTPSSADPLLLGKTIVGGLLGGMVGVLLVKRILGIRTRMGNVIAPAAALAMGIGRIGCFLNGCCYGKPVPWGVDFGDGVPRYPTQLFEAAFDLAAFVVLHRLRRVVRRPGVLFGWFVASYLAFRFLIEYLRVLPVVWAGLTWVQVLCVVGIVFVGAKRAWEARRVAHSREGEERWTAHDGVPAGTGTGC